MKVVFIATILLVVQGLQAAFTLTCYRCQGSSSQCDTCTSSDSGYCTKVTAVTNGQGVTTKDCAAVGMLGCNRVSIDKQTNSYVEYCMCNSNYCNTGHTFRGYPWIVLVFVAITLKYLLK